MKLIERTHYMALLESVRGVPDIKVITGMRRSGKSKLMDMYIDKLSTEPDINIIRIKLNLKKFSKLKNPDNLYNYIDSSYVSDKSNYLFIDEVQLCEGFEDVINSLHEEEKYDIYLTGSNAFLLSSDLATLFRGRVFEISMYPFSFKEYVKYYELTNIDDAFDKYIYEGGLAGAYLYKSDEQKRTYVQSIFRTTIVRDIVEKYKIENEDLLIMLADYLMDNIGNKTSIRNIANSLTYKTNDKTVGSYLTYLCRSFMFYPLQRYDIKGKKYLESNKKYYLSDLSLRFSELGTKTPDWGHLYENVVAIELLRRGYEVYVGVLYNKEVDFVAIKNGVKTYIQVSDDIRDEATFAREISPLLSIKDAFPKFIITRTRHDTTQTDGVEIVDLARWLLNDKY